ncbi:MAG: ABC transporter ATP-binding protein [Polyangiaceae bacterium]|nr:ABC transporter ATP-binding protein [Polyangiaceae bacterium]
MNPKERTHDAPRTTSQEPKSFASRLRGSFEHFPRAFAILMRTAKLGTVALLVLTLVAAVLPLGIAYVGKAIVDAVAQRSPGQTFTWVLVELGLVTALALVERGLGLLRTLIGARMSLDINGAILEKTLALDLSHFEDPAVYDQLTRARREASSRPLAMVMETLAIVRATVTLIGYGALLLQWNALAVLALAVASLPSAIAEVRFGNIAFRLRNWRSPDTRKLTYLEYVLANDAHVKEVKLFGIGPLLLDRYRSLGEKFYREDRGLAIKRASIGWVLSLIGTGTFYGCYAWMALGAARGEITLGDLVLYGVSFRQGQQAFQSILSSLGGMYEHNLYMSNLFTFLAIPTSNPALAASNRDDDLTSNDSAEGIRFEGVSFRYPGQTNWAIEKLDLTVARGESVALVGHNGAGKTTLIKLLTGLYAPTEGRITMNGKDIADWDQEKLRKQIGVVFQDFNRYQLTVRENVGFGSTDHMNDEKRLSEAVDRGGATEVLKTLPGGLETQLGRWFKDGTELSGGQWQKIALARAFMREDASVLVLDEPTAALDAEAEHAVFERFRLLSKGRTTFLVSHRFPTVRMADRILVLDGGRVIEEGTHAELLAQKGKYAKMFELQAAGYQ